MIQLEILLFEYFSLLLQLINVLLESLDNLSILVAEFLLLEPGFIRI